MGKHFVLLLIGLMTCTAAFAQTGNVAGVVLLSPGGAGAAGATVRMHSNFHPDDSLITTTDAEGHFSFLDIASGMWGARADLEGHFPGFGLVYVPWDGGTTHPVIILGPLLEDTGAVTGIVLTADGQAADSAHVRIAQLRDPFHPHGFMAETRTDAQGAFNFDPVPAGIYNIDAGLMGEGFASAVIEVVIDQTTNVVLTLSDHHHHDWRPCDSLITVDLTGTVIVVEPDSGRPRRFFLDVNADAEADYRLGFGPPWYDPNGPEEPNRPENGAEISVHGGLLTYGEPPLVVVYEINGMFWRHPCRHGGHGGHGHGFGCDPDSIAAVELEGSAIVTAGGPFGDLNRYAIDINADTHADFILLFGPPWYDPNGPEEPNRPEDGQEISIVGGLMDCDDLPLGVVIVYEINGMLWREPGDTSGFGAESVDAGDPLEVPVTYLTASNYPNPFNPATSITYSIPTNGKVHLNVYDIVGREVATLVNANQSAGTYSVTWDAADRPSGIYIYRLSASGQTFTNKMVLMK